MISLEHCSEGLNTLTITLCSAWTHFTAVVDANHLQNYFIARSA